jgi:hypothetical protein
MRILMLCAGSSRRFSDGRLPLQENMENLNRYSLNKNNEMIGIFLVYDPGSVNLIWKYY